MADRQALDEVVRFTSDLIRVDTTTLSAEAAALRWHERHPDDED